MNTKGDKPLPVSGLRRRAEGKLEAVDAPAPEDLGPGQVRAMLHELRVHQIELEMQNEELRRAQVALEESRARYFELYDLAPVGYVSLSPEGIVTEANLTAARLFGTDRSALVNLPLSGFVMVEDQDVFYRCRNELRKTGSPQVCELRMRRPGISHFWARMEAAVASKPDETRDRAERIVISDITTLKQAEEALRGSQAALLQANQELRAAHAALEARAAQLRLLAGDLAMTEQRERRRLSLVLHDGLQQHLLAVKMRLAGVAEQPAAAGLEPVLDEIEAILDEAVKMSRSLSAELSPPILHQGDLADALAWLARWMLDQHHFQVELAIGIRPGLKEDVKILVFESVRELLLNACKHSNAPGARVSLEQADAGALRVAVSDAGLGFDPAALKPAGEDGGGFGLFSIRERIGLLGGELEIESTPSRGSRFTLNLPVPPDPPYSSPAGPEPRSGKGDRGRTAEDPAALIRVLLVDDHDLFRKGLVRLLAKDAGIRVVGQAANGREAVALAEKLGPDVILMDIGMPGMNGVEATRVIHRNHPGIRILGLSMYADEERAQVMREAGACAYKTKGCTPAELVSAIYECMSRR